MLKLPRDHLSYTKIANNGTKTAFLKSHSGVSTIGSIFSFGAEDSPLSGQTFLTLQAKLLDSIGSPENMFRHGVSPYLTIQRDRSTVQLTFFPGSEKVANSVLEQLFSGTPPSPRSIGLARRILIEQEKTGNITSDNLFECAACAASYNDPRHRVDIYNSDPLNLNINEKLISGMRSSALLFGSSDQENNLTKFADTFDIFKPKKVQESNFFPGTFSRKSSNITIHGSVIAKNQSMELAVISFPAISTQSEDFLTYKVIQKIFGRGSEFSSEGLGVGLNSLIYKNVMTFGLEYAKCHLFPYEKNGLLSFGFKADPNAFNTVARKLANCVQKALEMEESQLESAKEQAICELLAGIDTSQSRFLEFASHCITWGEAKQIASIVDGIRDVKKENAIKCIEKVFSNSPSVGVFGDYNPKDLQKAWKINTGK